MNPKYLEILNKVDVKKTAMYVGGALLLIALFLVVRKMIRKAKEEAAVDELMDKYEEASGVEPLTYPEVEYSTMADSIYTHLHASVLSLNGGFTGVNQKGVYDVMSRMKKDVDVYKLISVYGVREYKKPGYFYISGRPSAGLPATLLDVMTRGEIKEINEILKENGLTYQFS
ncbi:MAG: hypothetical protein IJZ06_08020 [Bacteroidales bacterium]|nr:hypothetical protein [Bacteroidales bacterium]